MRPRACPWRPAGSSRSRCDRSLRRRPASRDRRRTRAARTPAGLPGCPPSQIPATSSTGSATASTTSSGCRRRGDMALRRLRIRSSESAAADVTCAAQPAAIARPLTPRCSRVSVSERHHHHHRPVERAARPQHRAARHARADRAGGLRRRRAQRAPGGERDGPLPRASRVQGRREVPDLQGRQRDRRAAGGRAERLHEPRPGGLPHHGPRGERARRRSTCSRTSSGARGWTPRSSTASAAS